MVIEQVGVQFIFLTPFWFLASLNLLSLTCNYFLRLFDSLLGGSLVGVTFRNSFTGSLLISCFSLEPSSLVLDRARAPTGSIHVNRRSVMGNLLFVCFSLKPFSFGLDRVLIGVIHVKDFQRLTFFFFFFSSICKEPASYMVTSLNLDSRSNRYILVSHVLEPWRRRSSSLSWFIGGM
jgi:hypothetical protein